MAKKLLSLVSAISGLASFASAFVPEAKSNLAVYYGQGLAQPRLAEFCQDTTFDIINIGFINTFPDQDPLTGLPGSNFGNQCWADTYIVDGVPSKLYSQCPNLVEDIPACQAAGKKIFLSLGGGYQTYEIDTIDSSTKFADWLWGAFGPKTDAWESAGSPRPFGDAVVDGFDFDIEYNGSWGYANMIKRLRRRFEEVPERRFYISAAPQCPIPDEQLGVAIANSVIDFVWVQFYNSNPCSARDFVAGTKDGFNFDEWVQVIKNGANPDAKLYVGLPASALAANLGYYLTPEEVQPLVKKYMNKYPETFGGIMLWEATESMRNQIDGVSYGEKMKDILYDLDPNHPTPTPSPTPTPTPTPTPSSTTTTTPTTSTVSASSTTSSTSASSTTTSTPIPTPSTTTRTPTPSGSPSGSSTSTSTKTASASETSNAPSVTPSGSSTSVSSSSHVPTPTPSVSASSSIVSSSTTVSSSPVIPGPSTSSHASHSTSSTSIPSSTPGAHSPTGSSASTTSSSTTDCSESSTVTSSHSLSSTPSISNTPSASIPIVSPSSSTSTETTVTLTVFPTPSSSRVPTPSSSVSGPSTDCTETETDSTSSVTSQTSSTSTSRPVIPTASTSSRSTVSTSTTVTPTPSVSGVPTPSETTSSSQTTDSDCDETATASDQTESTVQPTTGLTTKPTDTGTVTTQPTTTEPATTTTVIVTSYTSICPTGFTTITTTITSTYCPGTASVTATGTDIPGSVQPTDIPDGWTTTVTVCNVCAATPTTVTLTLPPAATTGESTPAQPTDLPAEVPSDGGDTTIPRPESTNGESRPAQPTGNSPVGAPHPGEGYTTIIGPGSTTTVVVVPAHPVSTSKPVIGGVSSAYPSSTFYVQPSASRVPVAPSGTQGGETPVFTGAASRVSGLAKGASMFIAAALSVLVVM